MKLVSCLGFAIAALLVLLVCVPWTSTGHPVNTLGDVRVDLSFILSMPAFLERGLRFGTDLVFTYGPLGVLSGNVVPEAWFAQVLGARVVLALLFVVGWWNLSAGAARSVRWLGLANCLLMSFLSWEQYFWISFPLFGAIAALRGDTPGVLVGALALASAAVGYVKFNFFLVSAICWGTVGVLTLCGRVRQKWLAPAWLVMAVAIWGALGQKPLDLVTWVAACLDLSAGYGEAMAKGFLQPYGPLDVALVSAASLVLLALVLGVLRRGGLPRAAGFGVAAVLAMLVFVSQRHAWGGNQLEQAVSVLTLVAFVALGVREGEARPGRKTWLAAGLVVAALWTASARNCLLLVVPPKAALQKLEDTRAALARVADRALPVAAEARERAFDAIRAMFPELAKMRGTADAMPDQGAVLLAFADVVYTPRPAYLSLNAHTQRLAVANAEFFASERAPQNLLYEIVPPEESVHRRLPASLDGLALRTILQRYRFEAQVGPLTWLVRAERPAWRAPTLSTGSIAFGERVAIPPGAVVWAEFAIRKSTLGAVVDQVYKVPRIEIRYHGEGREESWQILPRVAEKGFFVAPRLAKTKDVLELQRTLENGTPAQESGFTSFEVRRADGPEGLWQDRVGIRMETWGR